jgi:hypothetical protein
MATLSDGAFRWLSQSAPPRSVAVAQRLSSALATVPSFDALVIAAEQHGLEPLVPRIIERTGLAIPADVRVSPPREADAARARGGSPEGGPS